MTEHEIFAAAIKLTGTQRVAFLDANMLNRTVTGDPYEFIGRNGSLDKPAAMDRTRLSNKVGAGLDRCAAIQILCELTDGEEREIIFTLGVGRDSDNARTLVLQHRGSGAARNALAAVKEYWSRTLGAVQITTPDLSRDLLVNGWLLYQTIASRLAETVLASVVAARSAGRELDTCELDLMCVNGSEYGYTVGAGMIVRFLDLYYAGGRPSPAIAVSLLARLGVSHLLRTAAIERLARPVAASVSCDGEAVPFSAYTLLEASTIPHLGLGARPFYSAGDSSGRFHLLAGDSSPGELLLRLPHIFVGRASRLSNLHDTAARHVLIEFAEPQAITINGDVLPTPVNVLDREAGPSVTLIRPPVSGDFVQ